ncbi:hypothetical protein PI125_g25505 [Phytophthora idaei]|nr:hypothetical protein PI125_g25505 [Phytophthora idaei]
MEAALITSESLRMEFALSNLSGRAKRWAYTREATSPGCFASWAQQCEQFRAAFQPANYEYRQRSRFLSCKHVRRELHEYIQVMRVLTASLVGNPLPENIKMTMFMDGLKVGPARTQLFRVQASTLEEEIQVALQEEYSHRQARTPAAAWPRRATLLSREASSGPVSLERGLAEQQDIRCFSCGKLGHMARACPAGVCVRARNGSLRSPLRSRFAGRSRDLGARGTLATSRDGDALLGKFYVSMRGARVRARWRRSP